MAACWRAGTGKQYSLDVEAESTYDAADLFLTKAKEHVIREPLPTPSLETISRSRSTAKYTRYPAPSSNDGSTNDEKNGKDHADSSSTNDPRSDRRLSQSNGVRPKSIQFSLDATRAKNVAALRHPDSITD